MVKYLVGVCAAVFAVAVLAACGSSQDDPVAKSRQASASQIAPAETFHADVSPDASANNTSDLAIYERAPQEQIPSAMALADQVWEKSAQNPPANTVGTIIEGINLTDLRDGGLQNSKGLTVHGYPGRFGKCVGGVLLYTVLEGSMGHHPPGDRYFVVNLMGPVTLKDPSAAVPEFTNAADANAFLAANHAPCFD
ncbi:hypothetical protein [Mycolicibacter sinensis]|uniref:hypothetical protein n=1 Tax=Mycolicibacter sinensis (strain JDM601) TaxID=875328 RepID=UPI001041C527|nr:hypothetical protein [Mycolicibacter sinensis]